MDYSIIEIDVNDESLLDRVNRLLTETFGPAPKDKLQKCTQTNSPHKSVYLAAVKDEQIIGFNAFISHDFFLNGTAINCYQSCFTATSNAHRGKKIFQNLIKSASEQLLGRGAAFIFGFPNENSQPIFTKKLGFKEIPSLKWQVPNMVFIRDFHVNVNIGNGDAAESNAVIQNDAQLIELKKKQYGDDLMTVEFNENLIWGTSRTKQKFGLTLKYFEIGGLSVQDPGSLKTLFKKFYQTAARFNYFQLSTSVGNSFNKFLKNLRPAQTNDLIVLDLNLDTEKDIRFNFFGGVKDVF